MAEPTAAADPIPAGSIKRIDLDIPQPDNMMDIIIEKLKILDYETEFCEPNNVPPFSHIFFSIPFSNTSIQSQYFNFVVTWLMQLCKQDFTISEYDDPDTIVSKLMHKLKEMDFPGSFPAQKLKTPYGYPICAVLDFLCDTALTLKNFKLPSKLVIQDEEEAKMETLLDDTDDNVEIADDLEYDDAPFDENESKMDDVMNTSYMEEVKSDVDPLKWRQELDRVAPKLKPVQTASTKEWRTHLEQMQQHTENIKSLSSYTNTVMNKLSVDLERQLDQITQREKTLTIQFSNIVSQYGDIHKETEDKLSEISQLQEIIGTIRNDYDIVKDKIKELKEMMGTSKNTTGDTGPIMRMKQAISALKKEINGLSAQIGVVSHAITQTYTEALDAYEDDYTLSIEEEEPLDFSRNGNNDSDSDEDDSYMYGGGK